MKLAHKYKSISKISSIAILFWLITFVLQRFKLYTFESDHLLLFDADWIWGHLTEAGGLNLIISSFLTQFFRFPMFASIATAIIYTAIAFCLNRLITNSLETESFNPLSLIPIGFLFLCIEDPFYGFRGHTALAFGLLATLAYLRIVQQYPRQSIIIAAVASLLLYATIGSVALLFAATIITVAILKHEKPTAGLVAAVVAFACSLTAYLSGTFVSITESTLPTQYYNWPTPFRTMLFAWLSVPVALILAKILSLTKIKQSTTDAVVATLIVAGFGLGFSQIHNAKIAKMQHECYLADNNRWNDIVELNKRHPSPTNIVSYTNLALAMQNQLLDRMFDFEQQLPAQRTDSRTVRNEILRLESAAYFLSGHLAQARKAAFNSALITPDGVEPHDFLRLIAINKAFGNNDVSQKHADVLSKTLFYSKIAKQVLADTNTPKLPPSSNFCEIDGFANDYRKIVETNPQNTVAQQFYIADILLTADKKRLLTYIEDNTGKTLHRRVQEACTIMFTPDECYQFGVSESVINEFEMLRKGQKINNFYSTYWYYIAYLNTTLKQK